MTDRWLIVALLGCLIPTFGCTKVPAVRFVNAPIVWEVDDRRDVPVKPYERPYYPMARKIGHGYAYHLTDTMSAEPPRRALDVNALGEVPDSTWFTNRIGLNPWTPAQVAIGPDPDADPSSHMPWTILRAKGTGVMPGFLIEDARGVRYLLKLGFGGGAEMETGAEVIVQRLLSTAGYHTPQCTVAVFEREDLRLSPGAVVVDPTGKEQPVTEAYVDEVLALADREPGGGIRAVTSRFLPGEPIGGYPERGVRSDDPNDVIPHEERRELRGQYVFFAWVGHTDVKEANTVDIWREHPTRPDRHYVEHYLVDFGQALGVRAVHSIDASHAYNFDPTLAALSLLTLGIRQRTGERARGPDLPGVGRFEAQYFHPARFRAGRRYRPFDRLDRFDAFWATKILMRFSPGHIAAAVEEGRLLDPRAREYLVETLVARQRRTALYWFSKVNPLDTFTVREPAPGHLQACAVDLLLAYDLADETASTRYTMTAYGDDGTRLAPPQHRRGTKGGRFCTDDLPVGPGTEGYTMIAFATKRGEKALNPVWLHLARAPGSGRLRVIGIWRQ